MSKESIYVSNLLQGDGRGLWPRDFNLPNPFVYQVGWTKDDGFLSSDGSGDGGAGDGFVE